MATTKAHLVNHIDHFFGIRNKRSFRPVEGVNYTLETLSYMTPESIARNITDDIVKRMPTPSRPFFVFECCAGIGGNTLSFAENPAVQGVYAFERDEKRQEMLRQNVNAYGLEGKVAVMGEFQGVPDDDTYRGSVLYMDPPWLPPTISGDKSTPDQYLLSGIKIGAYTLEEWAHFCKHCSLIVMRVPPGYKLGPLQDKDTKVEIVDLNKSRLYIITNPAAMKYAEMKGVTSFDREAKSKITELSQGEWIQGFQYFIYDLLKRIIPDDTERVKYVDAPAMKLWLMAFTHESFSRKINYEELEIIGDRILEYAFTKYITRHYPQLTKKEITQLKRAYMSRKQSNKQPEYAQMLGFAPYIRYIGLELTNSIYEDVFESFFGALDEVSDLIKPGLGAINVYNFVKSLFDQVGIDLALATEGDKSLVYERFNQFGWGRPEEEDDTTGEGTRVTIKLTPQALQFLSRKGLTNVNPVLGSAMARTKVAASKQAYTIALQTIERLGVQPEKLAEEREKMLLHNETLRPYLADVNRRLASSGFINFEFFSPKTSASRSGYLVQLFGLRKDGTKELLQSALAENREAGEVMVLSAYASGH